MKAVYPGRFDPVTYGHLDVIKRAREIFSGLIVLCAEEPEKNVTFSAKDRVEMLREATAELSGVEVNSFSGLLVDWLAKNEIKVVVRGLRAVSDFEYEFQMALTNKRLYPEAETVFLMTDEEYFYLSSSVVKELAMFGKCLKEFVPSAVERKLKEKYGF
ncbi:pantetheine-phosphate adenylyltransferase [bacterium]|nr:pantetheine-phosphate adenylyltransferase [bacterium]MBU1599814.1 pantetheine-phosphate adenylyltransferase [bacterium]MBU2461687.1 pantetheine-phosphate adenylyltransferase [bacterium]